MPFNAPNRGYLPDGFDPNDKPYYYLGSGWDPKKTKSIDLTRHYPNAPVYDQMDTDSCVGNATAAALWYVANRSPGKLSLDPSRHFIYYNARALEAMADNKDMKQWPVSVKDDGTKIRQAMKAISLLGVASEDSDPWLFEDDKVLGCNDRPVDAAYVNAKHTHAVEYCRLDPDHNDATEDMFNDKEKAAVGIMTLTRLKQSIHEGYPVVFGFNYYWKTFTTDDSDSTDPDEPKNKGWATLKALDKPHQSQPDSSWGGHAVVAVAWDDDNERVLCKNSWGQANHPYFWMPYHWITDFEATDDFWVVRTIDHSNPPTRIGGPVLDGHVEVTGFGWKMNRQTTSGEHDKASTAANSVIASVARNSQTADTFWVSPQGQVLSKVFARSNTGSLDLGSMEVPEGTSFGSPSTYVEITKGAVIPGAIAAVKRKEEHTDTFCIRCDGSICCYTKPHTKTGWSTSGSLTGLEIDGSLRESVKASIKGGIAVVSRIQGHQEIWYVTPEGAIEGLYLYEGDSAGWNKYELAPQGSADPSSFITAVTAGSERMFVFWISKDGRLSGKQWVNNGQSWRDTFAVKAFAPHSAAMRSRITAVSRRNDTVEVFFITPKGIVEATYWYESQGSWTRWNMAKYPARVDSGLTAIRLNDKRMEVLWVGSNNSLVVASFMEGWDWRQNVVAGPGSVMGGSPLGTFWRSEKSYSVMFQDYTNKLIVADFQEPE